MTQQLEEGESLVSFDVVSLFTNIPTDLAVSVASDHLAADDTLVERTGLRVESIISLLRLCLDATFFSFRGKYYQQTFGTAMGSPVSVTVADLVMEEIEQQAISTFDPSPRFWKRYVDDTCTALPSESVPSFHRHLNSINPHIQFTVEEESDQSLPFLDVLLTHHSDGTISTSVFRKPTHTDKYLDFSSHHPLAHKVSVIRTLYNRAKVLSSTSLQRTDEETRVISALGQNGYPKRLIHRTVTHTCLPHTQLSPQPEQPQPKPVATITVPYIQGLSEAIKRVLSNLNIRVCFRPHQTLRQLLARPKDPVPQDARKGVIYKIPCRDCDSSYVGQSKRSLAVRLKEHQRAVYTGDTNMSALAEHSITTGHEIDWANATVLDSCQFYYQRSYLESWYIQNQQEPLNRECGPLPPIYRALFNTNK